MEINEEFLTELGVSPEQSEEILARYKKEKFASAADRLLKEAGALDCEAALALLGDGINSENFEEKLADLKSSHPALFERRTVPQFASDAGQRTVGRDELEKMSYRERLDFFKKNPDAYKRLV